MFHFSWYCVNRKKRTSSVQEMIEVTVAFKVVNDEIAKSIYAILLSLKLNQ